MFYHSLHFFLSPPFPSFFQVLLQILPCFSIWTKMARIYILVVYISIYDMVNRILALQTLLMVLMSWWVWLSLVTTFSLRLNQFLSNLFFVEHLYLSADILIRSVTCDGYTYVKHGFHIPLDSFYKQKISIRNLFPKTVGKSLLRWEFMK